METVYLVYHYHSTYNAGLVRIFKSLARAKTWIEEDAAGEMESMKSDTDYYRNRYGAKGKMMGRWTTDTEDDGDEVYEYTDEGRISSLGEWLDNLGEYHIEVFDQFDGQDGGLVA